MAIKLQGYVFKNDGTALSGATVQVYDTSDSSTEGSPVNTDSNGLWTYADISTDALYDVKISSGGSVRWRMGEDKIQIKEAYIRNDTSATQSPLYVANATNATSVKVLDLSNKNSTRADNDEIYISFNLNDDGGTSDEFARITAVATDVSAGAEDGALVFSVADTDNSGNLQEAFRISSSTGGTVSQTFTTDSFTIGTGSDTDIVLNFNANTSDGVLTWMEDEDYFKFSDEILMNSTEKILFGDTGTFIHQSSDGVLTITSDTTVDINGAVVFDGAITGATNITLSGELDAATLDISGNADIDGTLEADAITVDGTTLAEYISDTVGAMVTSNTESGITVAYQDGDNTLDFTVGTLNQDTTGTAAIATTVTITDNESTNEDNAIIFTAGGDVDGGNIGLESDGTLTYNPSTGKITATGFIGALTGNADTATLATTVTITDNENTNENNAIIFTAGGDLDGGNLGLESDGDLYYNPSTGTLTVTNVSVSGTFTTVNSVTMDSNNAVIFEGTSADAHETTLTSVDATGDRTISLPNVSGTLPVLAAASATQITATPAEINLIDGGESRGTTAVASGDGILINDDGTMRMTNVDTVSTYFASHSVGGGNIVTTGALNSGSITSGFGNIDNGSSTLDTGAITGTTIDASTDFTVGTTVITDDSIVMTPSTSDTVTIAGATNGVLNITTVDNAAAAANLNVTIDGDITLDAAGNIELDSATGIFILEDGGTEVLRITEGNSGDVTVKLAVDGKDLIFADNGDAIGLKILDAAAGINVAGEVQTTGIGYTDGDNAITIADGGGITAAAGITSTAASNTFGASSFNDGNITNVGDIALDSISADGTDINIATTDNSATAFTIKQGSDAYLIVDTANSSESVSIGTGISGTAITLGHSTSETTVADNLTVTGDTTSTGNITMGEAGKIDFGDTAPADNAATGMIFSFTAGATLAIGDVVYMHTDGEVAKADADAVTSMPAIGICVSSGSDGNAVDVMVQGVMHDTSAFPTFTIGNDLFVSTTAGAVAATAPSGSGDTVQKIGVAIHADKAYFNFNTTEILLA